MLSSVHAGAVSESGLCNDIYAAIIVKTKNISEVDEQRIRLNASSTERRNLNFKVWIVTFSKTHAVCVFSQNTDEMRGDGQTLQTITLPWLRRDCTQCRKVEVLGGHTIFTTRPQKINNPFHPNRAEKHQILIL